MTLRPSILALPRRGGGDTLRHWQRQTLNRPVGAKTDRLRAGPRVGNNVDNGRRAGLHSSVGALEGGANLIGFLNVLTVAPQDLGEFVVAGKTKVAAGHATHRSPAAV